ncbi:MAG: hypothetical protein IJ801_09275 [Lachnospiraceae bacterium]|nr:hypothetical protein [Lachnospiraceae bacterium]
MTYDEFRKLRVNDIIHRKIDANDNIYVFKITIIDDYGTKGQFYDPVLKDWVLVPPEYVGARNYVTLRAGDAIKKIDVPDPLTDSFIEEKWKELQALNILDSNNKHAVLPETWFLFPKGTFCSDVSAWFDEKHSKGLKYLSELSSNPEADDTIEALEGDVEVVSNTLAIGVDEEDEGFDINTGEDDDLESIPVISVVGSGSSMQSSEPLWKTELKGFHSENKAGADSKASESVVSDSVWGKSSNSKSSEDASLWKSETNTSAPAADKPNDTAKDTAVGSNPIPDNSSVKPADKEETKAADTPIVSDVITDKPQETVSKDTGKKAEEPEQKADSSAVADKPQVPEQKADTAKTADGNADKPQEANINEGQNTAEEPDKTQDTAKAADGNAAKPQETNANDTDKKTEEPDKTQNTAKAADGNAAKPQEPEHTNKVPDNKEESMSNNTADLDVMKQTAEAIRDEYLKLADQVANLNVKQFTAIQKYLTDEKISDTNAGIIAFLKAHRNLLTSIYDTGFDVSADDGSTVSITPKMLEQIRQKLDIQAGKDIALNTDQRELSDEEYLEIYRNSLK